MDAVLAARVAMPAFPALGADAVELHTVAADNEAEKAPDPLLQSFELLARNLHDLAAALADDVVVVLGLLLDRLIAAPTIPEAPLGGEAPLLHQPARPGHRPVSH